MNFLLALVLMAPASPGAVVVRPVANMYSGPSEDADVVSQAICGASRRSGGRRKRMGEDAHAR